MNNQEIAATLEAESVRRKSLAKLANCDTLRQDHLHIAETLHLAAVIVEGTESPNRKTQQLYESGIREAARRLKM